MIMIDQEFFSPANVTTISYGLEMGWVSPIAKLLQSDLSPTGTPVTDSEMSWIASTLCLAAVVGVSVYAWIADKYGRKVGVIATAALQTVN